MFATLQSLAMTGVLTGIGAGLIGTGVLNFLRGSLGGALGFKKVTTALQRRIFGGGGGVIGWDSTLTVPSDLSTMNPQVG